MSKKKDEDEGGDQYIWNEDRKKDEELLAHCTIDMKSVRKEGRRLLKRLRSDKERIIIQETKKYQPKYFTAGSRINADNQRVLEKEKSPFVFPADLEEFAQKVMNKAWRNEVRLSDMKAKCADRLSYRGRQRKDVLNRLYVEEPKIKTMKTIVDMNPVYYKTVGGRPIPDRFNVKEYIDMMRDALKLKIISGYREDDIMMIEENLYLEQKLIDQVNENYQVYVNAFEDFLYKDHTLSMEILRQCDQESKVANEKYVELKNLQKEYAALKSVVYKLEEKWRNCKMYQTFLYAISPIPWRKQHDPNYRGKDDITDDGGTTLDVESSISKCRVSTIERDESLQQLIVQFIEDCRHDREPQLYFTDPEQLMNVFKFMEIQNLNALLHSEELAIPLATLKEAMVTAEANFTKEIRTIQKDISRLEKNILWEEERAKSLEDLSLKLLNNQFKSLITDESALSLYVFVEDIYESRIGPNDANLSMTEMMRFVEAKFREELLKLDKLPKEQIRALETTYYRRESEIMKLAEEAAKQYVEIIRIMHNLDRALEPPYKKSGKELKFRSKPLNPPKPPPEQPRELTNDEIEYLEFFTDYCKYTDNLKDYGIDISPGSKPGVNLQNIIEQQRRTIEIRAAAAAAATDAQPTKTMSVEEFEEDDDEAEN